MSKDEEWVVELRDSQTLRCVRVVGSKKTKVEANKLAGKYSVESLDPSRHHLVVRMEGAK